MVWKRGENTVTLVERLDEHYLSQVIQVDINSDKSSQYISLTC